MEPESRKYYNIRGLQLSWDSDPNEHDVICFLANNSELRSPGFQSNRYQYYFKFVENALYKDPKNAIQLLKLNSKLILIFNSYQTDPTSQLEHIIRELLGGNPYISKQIEERRIVLPLIYIPADGSSYAYSARIIVDLLSESRLKEKFSKITIHIPDTAEGQELFNVVETGILYKSHENAPIEEAKPSLKKPRPEISKKKKTRQSASISNGGTNGETKKKPDQSPPSISNPLQTFSLTNDYASGDNDHLQFDQDVRAFASVIAFRDLTPPLAIALFGPWGSGKSFFMNRLQQQIEFLTKNQDFQPLNDATKSTSPNENIFCRGVVQIQFNAWSYIDANLWASLVAEIFERLDEYIGSSTKGSLAETKVRETLNEKLSIIQQERSIIEAQQRQLLNEKACILQLIADAEKAKADLLDQIAREKLSDLWDRVHSKSPLSPDLKDALKKYGVNPELLYSKSGERLMEEVKSWPLFLKNFGQFKKWHIILFGLAAVLLVALAILPVSFTDKYLQFPRVVIISLVSTIGPVIERTVTTLIKFSKIYEPIKDYKDQFNLEMEKANADFEKKKVELQAALQQQKVQLEQKNEGLANLDNRIKLISDELNHSVSRQAMFDFIKNKSKDEFYAKHLSIISTIRRDFETLSELFGKTNNQNKTSTVSTPSVTSAEVQKFQENFEEGKQLDRIVLYIDDLDRCPEDRVIEVLEAVNLLMAFPLFVVVVGVDPRWVKNSLLKKFSLQFGQQEKPDTSITPINVTDYLEKIFQIPFHLRQATPGDVEALVRSLLEPHLSEIKIDTTPDQLADTNKIPPIIFEADTNVTRNTANFLGDNVIGGMEKPTKSKDETLNQKPSRNFFKPEDLILSDSELDCIRQLSYLLGINPRAIKRFANIYRIIRCHESLSFEEERKEVQLKMLIFLIALKIGPYKSLSPTITRELTALKSLDTIRFTDQNQNIWEQLYAKLKTTGPNELFLSTETYGKYAGLVDRFSFESK